MRILRLRALVVIIGLVVAACSSAEGVDHGIGSGLGAEAVAPVAVAARPNPDVSPPETMPTTVAPDPLRVWVATAKPRVEVLETFDRPGGEPVFHEFAITNPTYYDTPLALLVTAGDDASRWLKVALPVRPNGTEAWIRAADVTLETHRFNATVNLTTKEVHVYDGTELISATPAVVGKPETATPVGRFYVNILLPQDNPYGAYGPWILGLSGFSEDLDTFAGGLPVIAIHGTNHPELMGQERSNGCIRVPNEIITQLAETVPLGTPVDIVR
ncbi:MAG: L,D-transpeptidase [Acidobacteria bacterium]|nr:L,D-transpeptidase [Acidobacteriota bacterium]